MKSYKILDSYNYPELDSACLGFYFLIECCRFCHDLTEN